MFLAAFNDVLASRNGRVWEQIATGLGGAIALAFGDGVWVAITSGGIKTSEDRVLWDLVEAFDLAAIADLAYGGGQFLGGWSETVVVAETPTVVYRYGLSADGTTWTVGNAPGAVQTVAWADRWYLTTNDALYARVGGAWDQVLAHPFPGNPIKVGGVWVVVSWAGVATSPNGVDFTVVEDAFWGANSPQNVAHRAGVTVAAGQSGLWASTNLTTWTQVRAGTVLQVQATPAGFIATGPDWAAYSPTGWSWTTIWTPTGGAIGPSSWPLYLYPAMGARVFIDRIEPTLSTHELWSSTSLGAWEHVADMGTTGHAMAWDGQTGAGMWRLRQRQSRAGDGWALRQRQHGGLTGSWPLRQRQHGL